MVNKNIQFNKQDLATICSKFDVVNLYVFGSVLTKEFKSGESDLDVLVEFSRPSLDTYFDFLDELRNVFQYRNIDLVTVDSLKNPVIEAEILSSREQIYAA